MVKNPDVNQVIFKKISGSRMGSRGKIPAPWFGESTIFDRPFDALDMIKSISGPIKHELPRVYGHM